VLSNISFRLQVEGDAAEREQHVESVLQKVIACSSPGNLIPTIAQTASNGPQRVRRWALLSLARLVCSTGQVAGEYTSVLAALLKRVGEERTQDASGGRPYRLPRCIILNSQNARRSCKQNTYQVCELLMNGASWPGHLRADVSSKRSYDLRRFTPFTKRYACSSSRSSIIP
jgi:hypothetical protein